MFTVVTTQDMQHHVGRPPEAHPACLLDGPYPAAYIAGAIATKMPRI